MNKEEYLEKLEQRSGYCPCPDLTELYNKRKDARDLEAKCEFFKSNADLDNPKKEDEKYLRDYKEEVGKLKSAVQMYYRELHKKADEGRVYFALHDPREEKIVESLPFHRAKRLLREYEPIISVHCNSCNQQIDVVSSID